MSSPSQERAGAARRTVVAAAGAAGLTAALAACGGDGDGGGGGYGSPSSASGSPSSGGSPSSDGSAAPSESGGGTGGAAKALAKTSEIPAGGGKIFKAQKVVVTQPEQGDFKAFSAICRHAGCLVGDVSGGTINCRCHGSKYAIADGSVRHGPATKGLPAVPLKVRGGEIELS
ncbi:Rieske (2Fe-2S) protein [Streptomyces purpurogeneiscleroticus]|uniref:Rieske (2Fe-2S) protein n=1 Tax=Streptomyces purpurogeneiscleroticus TaxID=68259 RepID=UPI001CC06DB0|nr:Rieske (2Fe-2S) protein [Streptomyces purpurogeneiscleroticus]MBZ4017532.1 Rieske (2Fe-2S) protein [Streptomyces purpurogeneiscleroticus]